MIACVFLPDLVLRVMAEISPAKDILGITPSGFVQAASRSAARRGVHVGMRVRYAQALVPDADILTYDETAFQDVGEAIEQVLAAFSTRIEAVWGFGYVGKRKKAEYTLLPASTACYFLDLGKLRGRDALVLAQNMQAVLQGELALAACIGLSRGKFPALVAARVSSSDCPKLLPPGEEAPFLAPFPVRILPLERETGNRLEVLGIHTLGALAALPRTAVIAQFGKTGRALHELSQGYDARLVISRPRKPSERLSECLDGAVDNRRLLEQLLEHLGCGLEERLTARGYITHTLELILHLESGKILKQRRVLREPLQDGRRIGRQLLRLLAQTELPAAVVKVEAIAHDLAVPVMQQLELFAQTPASHRLTDLAETLSTRFDSDALYCVSNLDPEHWLLDKRFMLAHIEVA